MKQRNFSKDFILVIIGQIISLFGNGIMRFALPIHLLDVTGSAKLLGLVSGLAFLPLAVMSPVGGLIADRVNKKNIMVCLDFLTAGLFLIFLLLYGTVSLAALILVTLFLLYGISGAYQPSVQASVPVLVKEEGLLSANAAINMVSSLSSLLGPALGGMAYAAWGITPLLYISIACFTFSAVMELFIHIPFAKRKAKASLLTEARQDMKDSLLYICRENPVVGKLTISCSLVNFALSALMVIGLPVIVMEHLRFPGGTDTSQMYGYLEASLGLGGLLGGLAAGMLGRKLQIRGCWKILLLAAIMLIPMGLVLLTEKTYLIYGTLVFCGLAAMAASSLYSIQIMTFVQMTTPGHLIGKVIAWVLALCTCAMPAGQILYGFLFDGFAKHLAFIFFAAALVSVLLCLYNKRILEYLDKKACVNEEKIVDYR